MYTCTGKLRTCVHLVLYVARLQNLRIDIDLNLLHQYPQTQPVASKDEAKKLDSQTRYPKEAKSDPKEDRVPGTQAGHINLYGLCVCSWSHLQIHQ